MILPYLPLKGLFTDWVYHVVDVCRFTLDGWNIIYIYIICANQLCFWVRLRLARFIVILKKTEKWCIMMYHYFSSNKMWLIFVLSLWGLLYIAIHWEISGHRRLMLYWVSISYWARSGAEQGVKWRYPPVLKRGRLENPRTKGRFRAGKIT